MTLSLFPLDDALTDIDLNDLGWRLPKASGPEGFANSPR